MNELLNVTINGGIMRPLNHEDKSVFQVWVDCTTLGKFDTIEEAVNNADKLINQYIESEGDDWGEDTPRIYEEGHGILRMYSIKGEIIYDFVKEEKERFEEMIKATGDLL